ncbi:MAG: hypothetical protein KAS13_06145 [Candidatus Omnitrophica bacterium]|nr:hypothetical protein [Candidatus Omnitrophota bacterium]
MRRGIRLLAAAMMLIYASILVNFSTRTVLSSQENTRAIKQKNSFWLRNKNLTMGEKESATMLAPNICMQMPAFQTDFTRLIKNLSDLMPGLEFIEGASVLNLKGAHPATLNIFDDDFNVFSTLKVKGENLTVLEKIEQVITEDKTGKITDGRSDLIVFEKPIKYREMTIKALSLRLKAVLPQVENGEVLEYVEGAGKTPGVPTANNDGEILNTGPINTPFGTMLYENALREYKYHQRFMAKNIPVDTPIGEGYYNDLLFRGNKVGFVLFVMESVQDDRCNPKDDEEHVEALAGLLRRIHDAGFIHRFPHFGNFAKMRTPEGIKFIAKDLDRVLEIGGFPEGKQEVMTIAFRWLDTSRMLWEYLTDYREWPDETAPMKSTFQVVQKFARGYFGKNWQKYINPKDIAISVESEKLGYLFHWEIWSVIKEYTQENTIPTDISQGKIYQALKMIYRKERKSLDLQNSRPYNPGVGIFKPESLVERAI